MVSSQEDYIYSVIGVIGGLLVAFSQIPSIVRIHKRQQALDISYAYQFILGAAIILSVVYYAYYKSILAYTTAFSGSSLVYLVGLKFHMDRRNARRVENAGSCTVNGVTLEHALLPDDYKPSNMQVDENLTVDPMQQFHRIGDLHNV